MEPEHLEIVTDVADDGELARSENVVEPRGELRPADAAGQAHHLHGVRARATLC